MLVRRSRWGRPMRSEPAHAPSPHRSGRGARSLPAGTLSLEVTQPTCTVVREDIEFDCTLARAPRPAVSDWRRTVGPTVDDTEHVNGGCRSLQSDGRHWRCYLGEEAVRQRIIGAGFLGEHAPWPGVG
jgi:hypothetical protein